LVPKGQRGGRDACNRGSAGAGKGYRLRAAGSMSATVRVAARTPVAAGLKATLMVQLPPAATVLPQLLVWAKSLALAPESARLVTLKAALRSWSA